MPNGETRDEKQRPALVAALSPQSVHLNSHFSQQMPVAIENSVWARTTVISQVKCRSAGRSSVSGNLINLLTETALRMREDGSAVLAPISKIATDVRAVDVRALSAACLS